MPNVVAFLSYVFITTFTPGPNNIMSMYNASRYGFRQSLKFNVGIFIGFFLIIAICSAFSLGLHDFIPSIRPLMTLIGAVYILWLAWKIMKSNPVGSSDMQDSTNSLKAGILLQFVNPKVILYGITTVSIFIIPYYDSLIALAIFALLLASVGFIATCCWALFGSLFQEFLSKNQKTTNTVMSILLVYCAISLFL